MKQGADKPLTKRQKVEAAENLLITKAIACMDKVSTSEGKDDSFELFGRYVASELRTIASTSAQRWAKLQIQNVLYNAQVEHSPQPMEPLPIYPPAPINFSRPQYRQSPGLFPAPSDYSTYQSNSPLSDQQHSSFCTN